MFGHSCKTKIDPVATNNSEAWKMIGKAIGGGGDALEAVTKEVTIAQSASHGVEEIVINDDPGEGNKGIIFDQHQASTSDVQMKGVSNQSVAVKEVRLEGKSKTPSETSSTDPKTLLEPDPGLISEPTCQDSPPGNKVAAKEMGGFISNSSKKKGGGKAEQGQAISPVK